MKRLQIVSKIVRRLLPVSVLIILLSCSGESGEEVNKAPKTLDEWGREWINTLCSKTFMGRRVGTEGATRAYAYLTSELSSMGYTPEIQVFYTEGGSIVRNIIVTIPGQVDSMVIVGAHYDGAIGLQGSSHYPAANDNGSGTVALLLLLKQNADNPFNKSRTIVCCFWDGEEAFEGSTFRGSTYYAGHLPEENRSKVVFYVNLDTIGHNHAENPELYVGYYGDERMKNRVDSLVRMKRLALSITDPPGRQNSDYVSFYKEGFPYINLHDHNGYKCPNPSHSIFDTPEEISIYRLLNISYCVRDVIDAY